MVLLCSAILGAAGCTGDNGGATSGSSTSGSSSGATVSDAASAFTVTSSGFLTMDGGGVVFPASASSPQNQSPPFSWSGAPALTRGFALTFVDLDIDATKWMIWDIPSTASNLPPNVDKTTHPANVPGATQLGSLGNVGYAGPGVPTYHRYEFLLWALDVATLPGTAGASTDQLRKMVLPAHVIAQTNPYLAEGKQGGP